jgi:hypothetical protein
MGRGFTFICREKPQNTLEIRLSASRQLVDPVEKKKLLAVVTKNHSPYLPVSHFIT